MHYNESAWGSFVLIFPFPVSWTWALSLLVRITSFSVPISRSASLLLSLHLSLGSLFLLVLSSWSLLVLPPWPLLLILSVVFVLLAIPLWCRNYKIIFLILVLPFSKGFGQKLSPLVTWLSVSRLGRHQTWLMVAMQQFWHWLRKIDLNSSVVDNHIVHFNIGLLTGCNVLELDKAILQTLPCLPVSDNLYTFHWAKPWKYDL